MGTQKPLRILCGREIMVSIADSVHQLLCDQIGNMGLDGFYEVGVSTIRGRNDPDPNKCTQFRFQGLKTNISQVKSFEGIDIVWCEECDNLSANTLRTLIPTIRGSKKSGRPMDSELWFSFNPKFPTDPVYRQFVLNPDPARTLTIKMNYLDNPWFAGTELQEEMEYLKQTDYDEYMHVYEGECRKVLEGAVYAHEIREAERNGRFCNVPYDPKCGVEAFFDIGWADATAIWIVQRVGFETHVIDYYEDSRKPLDFYLNALSHKPYPIDKYWLPHDSKAKQLGTGTSVEEIMRNKGKKVQIVPNLSVVDGINALRSLFPSMYFDQTKCEDGINMLRQYRYEVQPNLIDDTKRFKNRPEHDHASHAADAARYCAIALKPPKIKTKMTHDNWGMQGLNTSTGWMQY